MDTLPVTPRTTPHREKHRIRYDRALVHSVLDEALICHLGLDADGPLTLPVMHARIDDHVYVHVSTGSGIASRCPTQVCVTVTLLDGLVLAKSQFNHSMNFRCVVIRGEAEVVEDRDEVARALDAIVERVSPGRSKASRRPNRKELAATAVLRVPILEASAKIRTGPPEDEPEDADLPYWAGVIPFTTVRGAPEPTPETVTSGWEAPA